MRTRPHRDSFIALFVLPIALFFGFFCLFRLFLVGVLGLLLLRFFRFFHFFYRFHHFFCFLLAFFLRQRQLFGAKVQNAFLGQQDEYHQQRKHRDQDDDDPARAVCGEVLTTEKVTDSYSPAYNQVCYRLPAGNYYLDGGITLDYPLYVPDKAEVKLCLNGNSITANGDFDAVLLCLGALDIAAPFTLTDCKGEAGKYGQITHASGTTGSGVYAYAYDNGTEARFDMFGGEISGNTAEYGGGVRLGNQKQTSLRGYFNLYGGTITNNKATENGGGVYTGGRDVQFNLYGGEISNNTAKYGGGICASNGSVTMAGGTVSGNEAVNGGGVVVNMGGGGTTAFNMSSGEITGNKASL